MSGSDASLRALIKCASLLLADNEAKRLGVRSAVKVNNVSMELVTLTAQVREVCLADTLAILSAAHPTLIFDIKVDKIVCLGGKGRSRLTPTELVALRGRGVYLWRYPRPVPIETSPYSTPEEDLTWLSLRYGPQWAILGTKYMYFPDEKDSHVKCSLLVIKKVQQQFVCIGRRAKGAKATSNTDFLKLLEKPTPEDFTWLRTLNILYSYKDAVTPTTIPPPV